MEYLVQNALKISLMIVLIRVSQNVNILFAHYCPKDHLDCEYLISDGKIVCMTVDDNCGHVLAHKCQIKHLEHGYKALQSSQLCFHLNAEFFWTKGENVRHAFCWLEQWHWWKTTQRSFEKRLTLHAFSGG